MSQIIVRGTDNETPIFKTDTKWTLWNYNEIYLGEKGKDKFIPAVGDGVVNYRSQIYYEVKEVDQLTQIPVLEEIIAEQPGEFQENEILIGVGKTTLADTYRAYLNTRTFPYVMSIDARLSIKGTNARKAIVFQGADISEDGVILSQRLDNNQTLVDYQIPLEVVAINNMDNYAIKSIPPFHTNQNLPDGEIITVVIYNDVGGIISKRQLLVENTNYIRLPEQGIRLIDGIHLETPFLSSNEPDTIRLPLNVPLQGLNIIGVVNYADGSLMKKAIDNTSFELFGLNNFIGNIIGQRLDIVLSYRLESNEGSSGIVTVDNKKITKQYTLIVDDPINAYSVKLMGYPVWIGSATGYSMKWYLLNLDRTLCEDVTDKVQYDSRYGYFNPKGYGQLQRLMPTVMMSEIIPGAKAYKHSQLVDVILESQPDTINSVWKVDMDLTDSLPPYGTNVRAVTTGGTNLVDITMGEETLESWLNKTYSLSKPLTLDHQSSDNLEQPTHVEIRYGDKVIQKDLTTWPLESIDFGVSVGYNQNVYIKFIKKTVNVDQYLSIIAMMVLSQ